jgi:hypothetical protein
MTTHPFVTLPLQIQFLYIVFFFRDAEDIKSYKLILSSSQCFLTYTVHTIKQKSRDHSVGTGTGYGLDGRGIGVRFPTEVRDSSLLHRVQGGSEAHPASYSMDTTDPFPRVKQLELEADHTPPPSAQVKSGGAIPPLPHISSWRSAVLILHRKNLNSTSLYEKIK